MAYDPTEQIIQNQREVSRAARSEAIREKQYNECNVELRQLANAIRAASVAKGNPEGVVTFGTGPKDVDIYLGLRFMELQKKCEAIKEQSQKTQEVLKDVRDIPALTW
jgi:hypothetical protein